MSGDLVPPSITVVGLGLGSSISWGISDFLGGLTSKRAPLLPVMAVSQLVGVAIALPVAAIRGEAIPSGPDVAWSIASGVLGGIGLGCLYHGLAVGRMGVVAPIAGVLVALIPVVFGIAIQGVPAPVVLAGIVLAIASVAVVSRVPSEAASSSTGFWWGLGAGLTLGGFTITISRVTPGLVFGPLAMVRTTEALGCIAVLLATRRPWRLPREVWRKTFGVGVLDMTGTAAYISAVQIGPLAVAAVLSALYPAATVLLAAAVLRERLTRLHIVGVVGAAIAVILIAGGQPS
jgi:drug/metabolite transporter (DMT)-like permease